jgi:hypothetical protein
LFLPFLVKYAYHLSEAVKELKQVAKHPLIRLSFNDLSPSERKLILEVQEKTIERNVNNLTRLKGWLMTRADGAQSWTMKSGGRLPISDQHKTRMQMNFSYKKGST